MGIVQYIIQVQMDGHSSRSDKRINQNSINIRDDSIRDKLFVCLPVLTVPASGCQRREMGQSWTCLLDFTHLVVPELPMNEQHEEIDRVKISNGRVKTSGKRPR